MLRWCTPEHGGTSVNAATPVSTDEALSTPTHDQLSEVVSAWEGTAASPVSASPTGSTEHREAVMQEIEKIRVKMPVQQHRAAALAAVQSDIMHASLPDEAA